MDINKKSDIAAEIEAKSSKCWSEIRVHTGYTVTQRKYNVRHWIKKCSHYFRICRGYMFIFSLFSSTSTCLSSSCSRVGYLSSLMKGLLRLVVRVRIPGALAPWLSMNLSSSSLLNTRYAQFFPMFSTNMIFLDNTCKKEHGFPFYMPETPTLLIKTCSMSHLCNM